LEGFPYVGSASTLDENDGLQGLEVKATPQGESVSNCREIFPVFGIRRESLADLMAY